VEKSTVIVAINAQLLRREKLHGDAPRASG
jgi:hypothetical protein